MDPSAQPKKPGAGDLFTSAKVVADACQATLHSETDKLDKAKVAGAAADLLDAASEHGHLKEKGLGKYVEKAEDYLHQYGSPNVTAEEGAGGKTGEGYGQYLKMAEGLMQGKPSGEENAERKPEGEAKTGEGYGQYLKMAEGLMHGKSGEEVKEEKKPEEGGGLGGFMKAAKGFF